MASVSEKQMSVRLTSFFLRFVGFWIPNSSREKCLFDLALVYTIVVVTYGTVVVVMDMYYTKNDFSKFAYALANVMTVFMVLIKLCVFTFEREKLLDLVKHCRKNFWNVDYDEAEEKILDDCENKCIVFVSIFTLFAQGTVCGYLVQPIIENIGKNETDRIIPFTIWFDLPVTTTPYFEILFFFEVSMNEDTYSRYPITYRCVSTFTLCLTITLYHIGVLYFCFDNLLCILNVHVHGQFRILCHRLKSVCDPRIKDSFNRSEELEIDERIVCNSRDAMSKLGECIRQHESLIEFVGRIEAVYTLTILIQVIIFSMLICLVSYQAFLVGGAFLRRIIFVVHSAGTFTQLFMFTLTCHDLHEGSLHVADAVFDCGWYLLRETDGTARSLQKSLIMIMMRAQRACYLTAFGFFPITLDTFMKINSTAVSYLTILRQSAA